MNNENPKQQLIDEYIKKVNNTPDIELNQDQKELIKEILTKIDPKYIQNAYQMLNQRVKIGFTFDEAPSTCKTNIALLVKDEKRSFTNNVMNASDFENSLIIGENYDALKNLIQIEKIRAMTGGGHSDFDIIYIDPPYNTESAKTDGNVSANNNENISASKFIYRDKFSRNGWLNMMKERLIMARQLLKEDGVIFVSIDDNEQAYLKVIMDEIFGEENFVCNFVWQKGGGKSDSKHIANKKEYILTYSYNINKLVFNKQNSPIENYKYEDENGKYSLRSFDMQGLTYTKTLDYPIKCPDNTMIYAGKSYSKYLDRQKGNYQTRDWCWTLSKDEFNERLLNDNIVFKKKNNEWRVYYKSYHSNKTYPYSDIINEYGNQIGSTDIKDIFLTRVFDFPKPTNLIKHLINLNPNKNASVLDFFAGSGTTGHAVLELNREDGGSRTYTLVTNNENNIGSNVTYERLYRINNGKGTKGETDFEWLNKNKPYNQNLNVYDIEYFDTSIDKIQKDELDDVSFKLLKKLDDLLDSLNIKSSDITKEQKLNVLTELNALDIKEENNNESK